MSYSVIDWLLKLLMRTIIGVLKSDFEWHLLYFLNIALTAERRVKIYLYI